MENSYQDTFRQEVKSTEEMPSGTLNCPSTPKLPPYMLIGDKKLGLGRVLLIHESTSMRYKFFHLMEDGTKELVHFKRMGKNLIASINGDLQVFKNPHPTTFHREFMRSNGLALYRGLSGCDPDLILENMLEFVESV